MFPSPKPAIPCLQNADKNSVNVIGCGEV
jgi:hypothetical protein